MDREKVIRAWELFRESDPYKICTEYPFRAMTDPDYRMPQMIDDTIALLKEQEAVKPVPPDDEFGLYRCGKCYHQLFRCVDKYCSRCGRQVKWK